MQRRRFIQQSAIISLGFLGLSRCALDDTISQVPLSEQFRYGPLIPDPNGYMDLPKGFKYKVIANVGEPMADGLLVPGYADGMASFVGDDGKVILVMNHELSPNQKNVGAFGANHELLSKIGKEDFYDFGDGETPGLGGVSTLVYNEATGEKELQYLALAGTYRNCAGGATPWKSWITCEEDVTKIRKGTAQNHGYNFEVPASATPMRAAPIPLKAMGRFNHEAICVHPVTNIVYQTEDRSDGLIYRFLPNVKAKLHEGGKLQVLAVKDRPSLDTRNWEGADLKIGRALETTWIDIDEVESPEDNLRSRGFDMGAARFARGEGMWYGDNELFFACTNGGRKKWGQVFKYIPSPYEGTAREKEEPGRLFLFAESGQKEILKNCDNLTIAPWGDVILCEDTKDAHIRGITPDGKIYTFGHNIGSESEFAGVNFSPSGKTMFVNIQGNGHTLAITGPWEQRKLLS